jgi:hypothetical protein
VEQILYNAIRTPDGTLLESFYVHDYKEHTETNGNNYMVDGGLDYIRRGNDTTDFEELLELDDGTHEKRVKYLRWGKNYDKDMNRLPETIYTPIEQMNTDHIVAILKGGYCKNLFYLQVFKEEINIRTKQLTIE